MPRIRKVDLFKRLKDRGDNEDDDRAYCQSCLQYGIRSKLKRRMYKVANEDGKPKLVPATVPDADRFAQCYRCGDITPLYNVKYESKIEDVVEPVNNPFDTNPGKMSTFTPLSSVRKGKTKSIYKRKKQYIETIKDEDIKKELLQGNIVNYYTED